ncbi:AT-hook motif nuclear-localized protein 28-like [Solanum dulcamara]|uniref:AT-hook motif nuclear-localized protein 28-like n=1 Tax=Solanum dulcamara TaxID=45834 RepID=UPI0024853FA7|nr:AT-hook motif nuclear-localized protein 28-like [Solanum dulcamara]
MKGKYIEERKNQSNNIYMFAKLHQTQNFHHHHQPPPSQPAASTAAPPPTSANDGATIEVIRRPRGRPPGSKNKPKPESNFILTTRDDHVEKPTMSPYILEIPIGADIIDSIYRFCGNQNMGLCILNGSGTVTNVTLKQPSINPADSTITFHGSFNILSISATIIPSDFSRVPNGFSISLAGPQGQVVGGPVIGPLLSAGPVCLIAATFNNPFYHKFPAGDDGDGGHSPVSDAGDSGPSPGSTHQEYCYSSNQLPSDVIWAPTARQPLLY